MVSEHVHNFETVYVNDRQTIYVSCGNRRIGTTQQRINRSGDLRWTPNAGESALTGELPSLEDRRFPTPNVQEAIAWIEDRAECRAPLLA